MYIICTVIMHGVKGDFWHLGGMATLLPLNPPTDAGKHIIIIIDMINVGLNNVNYCKVYKECQKK